MTEPFEHVNKGIELIGQGLYTEAEKAIQRGLYEYEKRKDKEGIAFALGRLGYCYEQDEQFERAKQVYEQAVAMGTDIPAIYDGLIDILIDENDLDRAFQIARRYQECVQFTAPARVEDTFIYHAEYLAREGQKDQVLQIVNRIKHIYSREEYPEKYWKIHGLLGVTYEQAGDLDQAMIEYAAAIQAGSTDQNTFKRYLINLEKKKQYDTELKVIEKALKQKNDATWEADLKKRQQRVLEKCGAITKGMPKALIPDFLIRKGEQNLQLVTQLQFSPQLLRLAQRDGVIYGMTGGKSPCMFAQRLDNPDRLWEASPEGDPDGVLVTGSRLVLYSREGTVAAGETRVYFFELTGKLITSYKLPGVPSQVAIGGGQIYFGCRDGKLYVFSDEGQSLWSYAVPGSEKPDEFGGRLCPYYVSAGRDLVAFTSYGDLFVLSPQGKLLYRWSIPDHVSTIKSDLGSFTMTSRGGSATALVVAPEGERVWVAGGETLYELAGGKLISKTAPSKDFRINNLAWAGPDRLALVGFSHTCLLEKGKVKARIPIDRGIFITANPRANRIAMWGTEHLVLATGAGTVISEVEFAKSIHHCSLLDDGRMLVGTRYAILFETNPGRKTLTTSISETATGEKTELVPTVTLERPCEEQSFRLIWRSALKLSVGSGKAVYLGKDGAELTIEQTVLEQFRGEGYRGLWSENNAWWEIMSLLFWDVIFARLPGVYYPQLGDFPGPHQDMPNDFFKPEFYARRKDLIEKRIRQLTQPNLLGFGKKDIKVELLNSYKNHKGIRCRPIEDWNKVQINEEVWMVSAVSEQQLIGIMTRLLENFNDNRKGLPDLFLVDPAGKPILIEVKGEKEKLADHQWSWARYLRDTLLLDVAIFRVTTE